MCVERTREPDTYRMEREMRIFVDRSCYGDVTILADNYLFVDNSQWFIDNVRDNV